MIKIADLDYLETFTKASDIFGGSRRRTYNGDSSNPRSSSITQFVNTRQVAFANAGGSNGIFIGNTAIALNINIVNIVAIGSLV